MATSKALRLITRQPLCHPQSEKKRGERKECGYQIIVLDVFMFLQGINDHIALVEDSSTFLPNIDFKITNGIPRTRMQNRSEMELVFRE